MNHLKTIVTIENQIKDWPNFKSKINYIFQFEVVQAAKENTT